MNNFYYHIFNILTEQVGLHLGIFGYYFVSIISTLACCFLVLIPFIVVYFIIKRFLQ